MLTSTKNHPFSQYQIGEVFSDYQNHYYRCATDSLWIINISSNASHSSKCYSYKNDAIVETNLTAAQLENFNIVFQNNQKIKKERVNKLLSAKKPLNALSFSFINFNKDETLAIAPHEGAKVTANSLYPIVGSWGADPCVNIALYDKQNKIVIFTHCDDDTGIQFLENSLSSLSIENTVAHLVGGNCQSDKMCEGLLDLLTKNNVKIVSCEMPRDRNLSAKQPASLAIDARTGHIFSPVKSNQLVKRPYSDTYCQLPSSTSREFFSVESDDPYATQDNAPSDDCKLF